VKVSITMKLINKILKTRTNNCAAVIVAAGTSSRMQGIDKILYPLNEEPILMHTIRTFQKSDCINEIVVVTRKDLLGEVKHLCEHRGFDKVTAVVEGGNNRVSSVMKGLDCVSKDMGYVAVHDGARPLVTYTVIQNTVEKAMKYHAAAPAIPVKDTIKIAHDHIVTHTPDRASLFAVQTPQVFDYDLLRAALTKALEDGAAITDDCSAVEELGMSVYLTQGDEENIKVTTPIDLVLAKAVLEGRGLQ